MEKPAAVNSTEAELLFRSPILQQQGAPILLEAMHFRFQPTWQFFLQLVNSPHIQVVQAIAKLPSYIVPKGGIRFDYNLGGGNMLDLGTYPMNAIRQIMGDEPEECTECKVRTPTPYELCDEFAEASFRFPGGRVGKAVMDMRAPVTTFPTFKIVVKHREVVVNDPSVHQDQEKWLIRTLTLNNFLVSSFWHRIDIEDEFIIRESKAGQVVKRWVEKKSKKIYTFKDAGIEQPSQPFWTSYRHQLEQFVNRIRDNKGSGLWVSTEDSIAQARMIDMAYEKSGLTVRPMRTFKLDSFA